MKTKSGILIGILALALVGLGYGGYFYYQNLRGVGPAFQEPPDDITKLINTTGMPLILPEGFGIEIFVENLPNARALIFDADGNAWLSQRQTGTIAKLTVEDGKVVDRTAVLSGLDNPHGLAFDPDDLDLLYFATENGLWNYRVGQDQAPRLLERFPTGGGHVTRTIGFGPDGRLYVTIGSSCNVCVESSPQRAAMWVYDPADQSFESYATGLRNSVFFVWKGDELWATDNGRDLIGDDIPPDEVNRIEAGKFYGWPYCYGQKVHDTRFDSSASAANRCANSEPAVIDLQAHSAALGLDFIPDDADWPTDWRGDLIVAYHGSWNRTDPTGYKLVRHDFDDGEYVGVTDFITGWLQGDGALGRPVAVVFHGQSLYVTDDHAGVIYRINAASDE
jgi:glucose/arabinose dehydrogenase